MNGACSACRNSSPARICVQRAYAAPPGPRSRLTIDELGFVPLSKTGAELLFEVISQRYERGSIIITSNPGSGPGQALPFDEWTEVFGAERLTGAILDRLTHHVVRPRPSNRWRGGPHPRDER